MTSPNRRSAAVSVVAGLMLSLWPAELTPAQEPSVDAIKHYILIDLAPGRDLVELDRWYLTFHSKEVRRLWGAWQRHYYSYMTRYAGHEADRFNVVRGRMTEIHFSSLDDFRASRINNSYGLSPFTAPPGGWRGTYTSTNATIPTNPNEDFLKAYPPPKETPYYRWIVFFRYPEGVAAEEGERWFQDTHSTELARLPGLRRCVAYRTVVDSQAYPRVLELWFDSYADWKKAILDEPPRWTPPPWGGEYPFVEMLSAFIGERPDVDFINDDRVIP
jgi:hypothetical protein